MEDSKSVEEATKEAYDEIADQSETEYQEFATKQKKKLADTNEEDQTMAITTDQFSDFYDEVELLNLTGSEFLPKSSFKVKNPFII